MDTFWTIALALGWLALTITQVVRHTWAMEKLDNERAKCRSDQSAAEVNMKAAGARERYAIALNHDLVNENHRLRQRGGAEPIAERETVPSLIPVRKSN